MIFRRVLFAMAGATALAVAAGVIVIALAFALHAALTPLIGAAWADCCVALAAAILIGVLGTLLAMLGRRPKPPPVQSGGVAERALDFVKSRPVTSLAGAVAAGVLAVRTPGYLGAVVRAFVEGRDTTPSPRRRK